MIKRFKNVLVLISLGLLGCMGTLFTGLSERSNKNSRSDQDKIIAKASGIKKEDQSEKNSKTNPKINDWCNRLTAVVNQFKWPENPCLVKSWEIGGYSVKGEPLVYGEFGNPDSSNVTLILSMVHGDEITPLFLGLRVSKWLQDNADVFNDSFIIVAPMVNPDGFYLKQPTRVNINGVDLNRNFKTADWDRDALDKWKNKLRSDPRKFPGYSPESEPETLFQIDLLKKYRPTKIISIHAPLNHLDYDGPNIFTVNTLPEEYIRECQRLKSKINAISSGFFPGSLGNYAGQEMGIPTFTLELPTSNYKHAFNYWKKFKIGIRTVIDYKIDYTSQK